MRCDGLLGGQSFIFLETKHMDTYSVCSIVQCTISMHSMLMLRGLGA